MESPVGLAQIWSGGLIYIVPFLFVLTIIVFFHELGHFLVGRWCGIKALVFSVGFGPELIGFNDRRGTRWKLAAVPLGGYVKFLGDENAASVPDRAAVDAMSDAERSGAFPAKSVGRRAATVAAGPIANFILAIVIFAGVAYVEGRVVGDPIVAEVRDGSPAAAAGFEPGDKVLSADGETIRYFSDLQRYVSSRADTPIRMTVERNGSPLELTVTPRSEVQTDGFGNEFNVPVVGLVANNDGSSFRVESLSPMEAVGYGVSQTWFVTTRTVDFMGEVITGRQNADQIGGPIRIAQVSESGLDHRAGRAAQSGGAAVGFHRTVEPSADSDAGRRTSPVLRIRGGPWPAPERTGAGGRVPNWARTSDAAYGIRILE